MSFRIAAVALFVAFVSLGATSQAVGGYKVYKIGLGHDFSFNSQGKVVFIRWMDDNSHEEVFLFDLQSKTERRITYTQNMLYYNPVIDKWSNMAWLGQDRNSGKREVYFYSVATDKVTQLTNNSSSDNCDLSISDDGKIAWYRIPDQVSVWDGRIEIKLAGSSPSFSPNGRFVAYLGPFESGVGSEVIRYDLSNGTSEKIADKGVHYRPLVDNNGNVIWLRFHGFDYGSRNFFYYLLRKLTNSADSLEEVLSDRATKEFEINSYGSVCWSEFTPESFIRKVAQVNFANSGATRQISSPSAYSASSPDIDDREEVVWQETPWSGGDTIKILKGSLTFRVSSEVFSATGPRISDGNIAWETVGVDEGRIDIAVPVVDITPAINLLLR